MERKMLTRYLILIIALTIFAGAAWYFTKDSDTPQVGVVLAGLETRIPEMEPTEMQPEGTKRPFREEVSHEL